MSLSPMPPTSKQILSFALLLIVAAPAAAQTPLSAPVQARTPAGVVVQTRVPAGVVRQPARPAFCPEGRLANGACVNPKLAVLARLTACVETQGLISFSSGPPCTTVYEDRDYRYPNAVFTDTKRALDIAFNRRSSSLDSASVIPRMFTTTRTTIGTREGPGTPNPPRYPLF